MKRKNFSAVALVSLSNYNARSSASSKWMQNIQRHFLNLPGDVNETQRPLVINTGRSYLCLERSDLICETALYRTKSSLERLLTRARLGTRCFIGVNHILHESSGLCTLTASVMDDGTSQTFRRRVLLSAPGLDPFCSSVISLLSE